MRRVSYLSALLLAVSLHAGASVADSTAEYKAKAGFLYNFIAFTEWPEEVGSTLNVCVYGPDPFGEDLNGLQGKRAGSRSLAVRRAGSLDGLKGCQVVYVSGSAIGSLGRILDTLQGESVLTVADSPGALEKGIGLNMEVSQSKIAFSANLEATRRSRVNVSSKLLRLAKEVKQ